MVNPIKTFFTHALSLGSPATPSPAAAPSATSTAGPAPAPAPVLGQEPAPKRQTGAAQTFGPAVIGGGLGQSGAVGSGQGKTLLGQ